MIINFRRLIWSLPGLVDANIIFEQIPSNCEKPDIEALRAIANEFPKEHAKEYIEDALNLIKRINSEHTIEAAKDYFKIHRIQISLAKLLVEKLLIEYARLLRDELHSICARKDENQTEFKMTKKEAHKLIEIGRKQWSSPQAILAAAHYAADPCFPSLIEQLINDLKAEQLLIILQRIVEEGRL